MASTPERQPLRLQFPTDFLISASVDCHNFYTVKRVQPEEEPVRIHCPYCSASIRPLRLLKHLEKVHFTNWRKACQSVKPDQVLACPCCKASVKATNLKYHIRKAHQQTLQSEPPRMLQSYSSGATSASDTHVVADWSECNSFDRRDDSKDIGYLCREYQDSRFGSFPMHDAYGEESSPD